ncbi:PAS domain S-box-containing protein [Tamilnaduibacter salinus]|uniref:histidine kinase n=1 Tax=Tamilnaduibacter salinus TaxID=1484056 RepID=A0A2A2I4Y3_9GAMM|nr:PAS domain S-box protein [Tamilnaduibacter salinus]PAV26344.1 PAS domain-containing sensor histidine kinase [Tamilnaduibacter salinus]PVY70725.1 PAS domain S-box-containing protein [Tamilnaduibacter salinus]
MTNSGLLLPHDPEPCLILTSDGRILEGNEAAGSRPEALLPVNVAALAQACIRQKRAITGVESRLETITLLWQFVPDPDRNRVIARARDVTPETVIIDEATRSNRLYRLITENTTDLISRHAPNGDFIDASPASWRLLGYSPETLRGKPLHFIIENGELTDQGDQISNQLRETGYATLTLQVTHRSGSRRWFETACRAIRETYTGAVVEIISVSRDVTARVNSAETNRRLAQVVEANTDLVLFSERSGRLTYVNPAARKALGLEERDEDDLPHLADLMDSSELDRLIANGLPEADKYGVWETESELHIIGAGRALPVSLVLLSHQPATGSPYYSLVNRDMTERALRESEQRRHQEELAHAARLATMGELASGIAHEMNQPLATIVNYANASQRYLEPPLDETRLEKVREGLQRITHHANHASEVIKRLRNFLQKGQRRVCRIALDEVIQTAVQLCRWEADKKHVTIHQALEARCPQITADPVLIEQVLLNLIRNAIDANCERWGNQSSDIHISTTPGPDGSLIVTVRDQGPGMSEEGLRNIFTPFYTSKEQGLGLGLSMSRSLVEGFGGFLDARNGPKGGLELICRFPGEQAPDEKRSS